jgi:hypothetical protein
MANSVYRFRALNENDLIALEEGYFWQSTACNLDDEFELNVKVCVKPPNINTQYKRYSCLVNKSKDDPNTPLLALNYLVKDEYLVQRFIENEMSRYENNSLNIRKYSGIVCFTNNDTSTHMWNTYGAEFRGAAFEYDSDKIFPDNLAGHDCYFGEVKYKHMSAPNKLNPIWPYLVEGERRTLLEKAVLRNLLGTKRIEFLPEAETRLCIVRSAKPQSQDWQKVKYQTKAIKKVSFGHLAQPEIIDRVTSFLGPDVEYWVTEPPKHENQEKINIIRL